METTKASGNFLDDKFNEIQDKIQNAIITAVAEITIEDKGFIRLASRNPRNKRSLGFIRNIYRDEDKTTFDFYSTSWKHPGRTYYGVELKDIE